jgi:hypothetical protein
VPVVGRTPVALALADHGFEDLEFIDELVGEDSRQAGELVLGATLAAMAI